MLGAQGHGQGAAGQLPEFAAGAHVEQIGGGAADVAHARVQARHQLRRVGGGIAQGEAGAHLAVGVQHFFEQHLVLQEALHRAFGAGAGKQQGRL
ncbi:MAG: hypothetical protein U1E77_09650 [Inhella sp.]